MIRLVCGGEPFEVKMEVLMRLPLFQKRPQLLEEGYYVKAMVDADVFRDFLRAAEGENIEINSKNVFQLAGLCKEFDFRNLNGSIAEYLRNHPEAEAVRRRSRKERERERKCMKRKAVLVKREKCREYRSSFLSSEGMQRVLEHDDRKFTFVVGDRKYECNLSQAYFLSPRVSRLLCSDNSVNSVFLDVDDADGYLEKL